MDEITFRSDTVLSDVHLLLPNARHLMARLNMMGQPVFVSRFKMLRGGEEQPPGGEGAGRRADVGGPAPPDSLLDEDGDLDVVRQPREPASHRVAVCPIILSQAAGIPPAEEEEQEEDEEEKEQEEEEEEEDVIKIEHTMATPLEDAGKQVWRGAFLLADFILSQPITFKGATVLELGAGTGLTSIVMATVAELVYCTDVGQDLLSMCQRNMALNQNLLDAVGGEVKVRQLDWTADEFCTDPHADFSWTEEEVADLHDNMWCVIAADVCYDDDLTDALFRTLYRISSNLRKPCTAYISIERRLNFTLRCMDVSCEAYDHFCHCLEELQGMKDGRMRFAVEQVNTSFPQFFQYERVEQLELWKVTSSFL